MISIPIVRTLHARAATLAATAFLLATPGAANEPPVVTSVAVLPASLDTTVDARAVYAAADPDGDPIAAVDYRWTVDGVEVGDEDGSVLPARHYARGDTIEVAVRARDAAAWGAPASSDPVTVINAPPRIRSVGGVIPEEGPLPFTVAEGETLSLAIDAEDPDGDPLSAALSGAPPGLHLDGMTLRWTPAYTQSGTHAGVTLRVDDGAATDAVGLVLTVLDTNRPPKLSWVEVSPPAPDTTTPLTAHWGGDDPDGDPIVGERYRWWVDGAPVPEASAATLPAAHFVRDATVRAEVRISDGDAWSPALASASIPIGNAAPRLLSIGGVPVGPDPLRFVVAEGETLTLPVVGDDPDGDPLTAGGSDLPPGVEAEGDALVWTPGYDHARLWPVSIVTVSDGELRDGALVEFEVLDTNRPPRLNDPGPQEAVELGTLVVPLFAHDPDGDAVRLSTGPLPPGAELDAAAAELRWTPDGSQAGSYAIDVTAVDVRPDASPVTVTVPIEVMNVTAVRTGGGLTLGFDDDGRLAVFGRGDSVVPNGERGGVYVVDLGATGEVEPLPAPGDGDDEFWSVEQREDGELVIEPYGEGSMSLRMSTSSASGRLVVVSEPIALGEDRAHRIELLAATDTGYWGAGKDWNDALTAMVSMRWLDAAGDVVRIDDNVVRIAFSTREWRRFGGGFQAPVEASRAVIELRLEGAVPNVGEASVWIRDVRFGTSPHREFQPVGTVHSGGPDRLTLRLQEPDGALEVELDVIGEAEHFRLEGHVVNRDPERDARAVDVGFALPLGAEPGWHWWDDPLRERAADLPKVYWNVVDADLTGWLPLSVYPLSAVVDDTRGFALAAPIGVPRIGRTLLDGPSGAYAIEFSLGLSRDATRTADTATFLAYLFAVPDPPWGMRSALERYYAIEAPAFAEKLVDGEPVRTTGEGLQSPLPTQLGRSDEFNVRYMLGRFNSSNADDDLDYALQEGLQVMHYTRPGDVDVAFGPLDGPPPDYEEILAGLTELAGGEGLEAGRVAGALESLVIAPSSDFEIDRLDEAKTSTPDAWNARLPVALDPEVGGDPNAANAAWEYDLEPGVDYVAEHYPELARGWFLDGVASSAAHLDLTAARFALADHPLSYSPNTLEPAVHLIAGTIEFLHWAESLIEEQTPDLFVAGNFNLQGLTGFAAPYADILLYETDAELMSPEELEERRMYHRFLGRHRPVAETYQPRVAEQSWTDWEEFEEQYLRPQWHALLLYAIQPGVLSAALELGLDPNPGRELYAQLVPVLTALQEAGWEPVTHAELDDPELRVERYGTGPELLFVVHNPAPGPRTYTLEIDLEALGLDTVTDVHELISGQTPDWNERGGRLSIGTGVERRSSHVLRVRTTR